MSSASLISGCISHRRRNSARVSLSPANKGGGSFFTASRVPMTFSPCDCPMPRQELQEVAKIRVNELQITLPTRPIGHLQGRKAFTEHGVRGLPRRVLDAQWSAW